MKKTSMLMIILSSLFFFTCNKSNNEQVVIVDELRFSYNGKLEEFKSPEWWLVVPYGNHQSISVKDDVVRPFGYIELVKQSDLFCGVIYPHGVQGSLGGSFGMNQCVINSPATYDNGNPLDPADIYHVTSGDIQINEEACTTKKSYDEVFGGYIYTDYCEVTAHFSFTAVNGKNQTITVNDGFFRAYDKMR
ncbi:hypothetical protein [Flavihumibacter fluvii]|uniref:hypothetical protein n=1 Tax=Flavihumibacter fluvii TaxID=2838157 RepID=UPI001BDE0706|nr:hypothetical protein [Flavihumibacter fluvii]ULQ50804.1 hypothetical protein KJS93_11990 [Flavihumibacter fluvii]